MEGEEHERLADELEKETDKLARAGEDLADRIDKARTDWRAKQDDPGVPGAVKPADADEDRPDPRSNT